MAKVKVTKRQPKWLKKIADEHVAAENRAINGRIKLVEIKLELEERIDEINAKYKTAFDLNDLMSITMEDEEFVMSMLEGEDEE